MHYISNIDKHYHDIEDLRSYNAYNRKNLVLDLKEIKNDPIRSKLKLSLYIKILEQYEPILEMLIYHLPFVLKSQLLEIMGYNDEIKSRSNGYKVLRDLEDNKLLSSKTYNGSQYVYASYRSYYYFGINKKSIETKPSERLLNKYFIFAEMYLKDPKKNQPRLKRYILFPNYKRFDANQDAFSDIDDINHDETKFIAEFIERLRKKKNFDLNNNLYRMLPNPYLIDELPQEQRALYLSLFLQETIHYFKDRCSINIMKKDDCISFFVIIIHESNRSWATYNNLINDLTQLISAINTFYLVTIASVIVTFDATDKKEVESILENVRQKRSRLKISENDSDFYQKSNTVIDKIFVKNMDVARRIPKTNQYSSNRNKPYKNK